MRIHLIERWQDLRPGLRNALVHEEPGSEIAEKAVMTGAVVAVGIGSMLAFMNGLGTFFAILIAKITAMVP
jgi:hypothetical protein